MSYKKHVEYHFQIREEWFAVSQLDGLYIEVEELRKNGQEDCHQKGSLKFRGNKWVWIEDSDYSFKIYGYKELPELIADYLNRFPHPEIEQFDAS